MIDIDKIMADLNLQQKDLAESIVPLKKSMFLIPPMKLNR